MKDINVEDIADLTDATDNVRVFCPVHDVYYECAGVPTQGPGRHAAGEAGPGRVVCPHPAFPAWACEVGPVSTVGDGTAMAHAIVPSNRLVERRA